MKQRVHDIRKVGDKLFADRRSLDSLWQQIAEQFYPERADFTSSRHLGADFADHLMTGGPSLIRRDFIEVTVADNGPGIPPELRDRVFDPFVTGRPDAGTGLGLYICQKILAEHQKLEM